MNMNTGNKTVTDYRTVASGTAVKSRNRKVSIRMMVQIGMLAAVAVVLMLFEVPLPFAPAFYKIDFSEVPVLVGCFAMGPFSRRRRSSWSRSCCTVAISGTTDRRRRGCWPTS
jgi:hypothetical protein